MAKMVEKMFQVKCYSITAGCKQIQDDQILAVQRMQDYIETHLNEKNNHG